MKRPLVIVMAMLGKVLTRPHAASSNTMRCDEVHVCRRSRALVSRTQRLLNGFCHSDDVEGTGPDACGKESGMAAAVLCSDSWGIGNVAKPTRARFAPASVEPPQHSAGKPGTGLSATFSHFSETTPVVDQDRSTSAQGSRRLVTWHRSRTREVPSRAISDRSTLSVG